MSEKKTIEINDTFSITVELIDDYDGGWWSAKETIGEYNDKPDKWAIDCKNGWLLGDEEDEPECDVEDLRPHPRPSRRILYPERYFHSNEMFKHEQDLFAIDCENWVKEHQEYKKRTLEYDNLYEHWENRHGRKILADVRRTCYDHNCYQFFHSEYAKYLMCEEKATELTPEQIEEIKKQYRRMYELNEGWWGYIGIEVKLFVHDTEIACESLWGIESDDKAYHKEVIQDLVEGLTWRIEKEIHDEIGHLKFKIMELEDSKRDIPSEELIKEKVLTKF